jgi:hypothetical protein
VVFDVLIIGFDKDFDSGGKICCRGKEGNDRQYCQGPGKR